MIPAKFKKTSKTTFYFLLAAAILVLLSLSSGCNKEEPTASVSFNPPGVYGGTYYVIRDWQDPDYEQTSLANVTFNFNAGLTFTMSMDSVGAGSEFRLCSVSGTYVYKSGVLTLTIINPHTNVETCDPNMGPEGAFNFSVVGNTIFFTYASTADKIYRRIEFAG
jgi:hypothetical protein